MKVNMDKTFCASLKCEKKYNCERNYLTLVNLGVIFDRQISMADFYVPSLECSNFIEVCNV